MINVLGLALYGPMAASTRVRMGQFVPGLAQHGIHLEVSALLGDDYLRKRFHGGFLPLASMARAGIQRIEQLQRAREIDLAMLYCELLPFMPGQLERKLIRQPYIYDLDDAFYLRYTLGRKRILSGILGGKFDHLMAGAAAVTAGNSTLAEYASRHNPSVDLLPTVVDTNRYEPVPKQKSGKLTVGWIGSPSTSTYLPELVAPLAELGAEGEVDFVVVGGKAPSIPHVNIREVPWSEASEVELINTFDIGVMPMPDDEWARGKCAYKLIQYMACGLPVIGSAVGANKDVVTAECGHMVSGSAQWLQAFRQLRDNPKLRASMGEAGRARVEEHYSLHVTLPKLATLIHRLAGK